MMLRWLIAIIAVFSVLAMPQLAFADDVFSNSNVQCNGKANESAVCQSKVDDKTDPITGSNGVLARIINIVTYIAGVASIIIIMLGGIRFITSDGDPGNIKSARNTVLYALLGIVVIMLARLLILFVIGKLN